MVTRMKPLPSNATTKPAAEESSEGYREWSVRSHLPTLVKSVCKRPLLTTCPAPECPRLPQLRIETISPISPPLQRSQRDLNNGDRRCAAYEAARDRWAIPYQKIAKS